MKLLKKINKGLVLTVIVLLALIIYIVTVEISRNKEKPNIEAACKNYIETINKYAVLPEDAQKLYKEDEYVGEQTEQMEQPESVPTEEATNEETGAKEERRRRARTDTSYYRNPKKDKRRNTERARKYHITDNWINLKMK